MKTICIGSTCFSCAGDILLTQTPAVVVVQSGESATISCKASSPIDGDLAWYHQKPGEAPKFIIDFNTGLTSGRYQGTGYDMDFTLTISGVQAEDAGDYYCQQHEAAPFTQ
uniref:Ig-like domain-containing protein n=1 Tax=Oncorhynchus mykiss TaxID=8022 RepID=A0A8C7VLA4_ONCMY